MLSCPGAMPKHISQGAIRNLITALNCSLSTSPPLSVHFPYSSVFSPFLLSLSKLCFSLTLFFCLRLLLLSFLALAGFVCHYGGQRPLKCVSIVPDVHFFSNFISISIICIHSVLVISRFVMMLLNAILQITGARGRVERGSRKQWRRSDCS